MDALSIIVLVQLALALVFMTVLAAFALSTAGRGGDTRTGTSR